MSEHFPDSETTRAVLTLATRAPSIYNSQPWRWRVDDRAVHLYIDPSLRLPHVDPDGRDLMLSCGAALNHCVIAFHAMGWRTTVHRLPDARDGNHLATIELHRGEGDHDDAMLMAAIPRRQTDRRNFGPRPVSDDDIGLMRERAAQIGVNLRRIDEVDTLYTIVAQAFWRHAANHEYLAELTQWSGRYGSLAGIPARNEPKYDTALRNRLFAGPALAQPADGSTAEDNAVILALGTDTDDRLSQLNAGEAASAALLTATAAGLASCPITEPLEIRETRDAVWSDVFGSCCFPQMLLRVGWAPANADPLPPTPRRALDDIVQWLSGDERNVVV
ncbi:NAD(P)H nitroreductase [Mycolicibacterium sp. ND9-15]|uniref:Acg family FMN-binding oxidoreductase n=1 Tax=Mycolicibacterium sp. ND9-15 TaxID=3042320 RepID=UPI002DD90338|nr:NAD(P)H nitroreductase [Mycolicibacterium sp. ND9-15]WSE58972.1 NAD(P)H nitroreductase [Mycolicibacterium sp. ND9-15]